MLYNDKNFKNKVFSVFWASRNFPDYKNVPLHKVLYITHVFNFLKGVKKKKKKTSR